MSGEASARGTAGGIALRHAVVRLEAPVFAAYSFPSQSPDREEVRTQLWISSQELDILEFEHDLPPALAVPVEEREHEVPLRGTVGDANDSHTALLGMNSSILFYGQNCDPLIPFGTTYSYE